MNISNQSEPLAATYSNTTNHLRKWAHICQRGKLFLLAVSFTWLAACATNSDIHSLDNEHFSIEAQIASLHIVDCLLPGQVRSLGKTTFLTPRRPIKTTAADCNIRGGEFVAYDRADYKTALNVWLPAAESGDAQAQVNVGEIFERGANKQPNYQAAAIWYQKAADQSNRRGQFNLGTLYEQGLGVEKDPVKSLNLYRLAWGLPEDNVMYQSVAQNQQRALENENIALNEQQERLEEQQISLRNQLTTVLQSKNTQIRALQKQIQQLEGNYESSLQLLQNQNLEIAKKRSLSNSQDSVLKQNRDALEGANRNLEEQNISLEDQNIALREKNSALEEQSAVQDAQLDDKDKEQSVSAEQTLETEMQLTEQKDEIDQLKQLVATLEVERQSAQQKFSAIPKLRKPEVHPTEQIISQTKASPVEIKGLNFGRYYALVIGNQDYQFIENLSTTQNDAEQMADILEQKYGFEVSLLINADRVTVMETINNLNSKLTEEDNLLIYYAGHGSRVGSGAQESAYWLPVNADPPPKDSFWVSSEFVTKHLARYKAKRVLVVADSCYAGLLSSSPGHLFFKQGVQQNLDYIRYKMPRRARLLITSGGDRPVIDAGGQGHSVFARVLLETLKNNTGILSAPKLFLDIKDKVSLLALDNKFAQTPEFKSIKGAGHEVGDFFFVPKG